MVKKLLILFLISVSSLNALETIQVSAGVQWANIYENQPIEGTVSVTHDIGQKIDVDSIKIGNKPLKVTLDKEVKIATNSPLVITIYRFTIPGMSKGLQLLPAISVNIAGKTYSSRYRALLKFCRGHLKHKPKAPT